jgi:uncharacterized protein YwgA
MEDLVMVNNEAIVNIISRITKNNKKPCKKTLQKIVFLIEAKKIDLGCDYGIHFYGPYSADLDFAVRELNDEGVLTIDYTPMEHLITVADSNVGRDFNNEIINEVVDEFSKDKPSDLELIATALYVYLQIKDVKKVKEGVIKIKGSKYSDSKIDTAIERLRMTGYIVA